jgi:metal-sulfur cluster biosynthetic enzyme
VSCVAGLKTPKGSLMRIEEHQVVTALGTVMDPDLNTDIVKAGMLKDVKIDGTVVAVRVETRSRLMSSQRSRASPV